MVSSPSRNSLGMPPLSDRPRPPNVSCTKGTFTNSRKNSIKIGNQTEGLFKPSKILFWTAGNTTSRMETGSELIGIGGLPNTLIIGIKLCTGGSKIGLYSSFPNAFSDLSIVTDASNVNSNKFPPRLGFFA